MWSTLSFLVLRRVLGVLRVGPRPHDKDVEIAVLRYQLAIVQRHRLRRRRLRRHRVWSWCLPHGATSEASAG